MNCNVKHFLNRKLQVPVTDHTYDDCKLMEIVMKNNLPIEIGLIEYNKINSKLGYVAAVSVVVIIFLNCTVSPCY